MTQDSFSRHSLRSKTATPELPARIRDLAEAGARGRVLTPIEVKVVCEALQTQTHKVRNQFHTSW